MQPNIQPGDLLIQKSSGWFGSMLRLFVGFALDPKYQHVAVVCADTTKMIHDGEDYDEATGRKFYRVGVEPLTGLDWSQFEVRRPLCDQATCIRALNLMIAKAGEPYGVLSLIAVYLRKFLGLPVPDGPGAFCSELVCWAFREAGYDLMPGMAPHDVTPWELLTSPRVEIVH
jgi:hypothetical protein